ncbi:lytic transglycosylase [Pseudomonas mangiferae]|uniref:LysM peptidoglycan-binding domain-containing protein n=1 Tax=Pseudomonas mangiferae TaxID=2593654 RepID=A0A553GVF8_9PSED|nr:LysM peptidoglycan-binding domain-containing protein [Pseudomonas mangiferae]TRX73477.1 LysM peptidoglycan-binding domain-containing protein [Pseudomonas mangiferae]
MPPTSPKTLDLDALGRISPALVLALTALLAGCQSTGGQPENQTPVRDLTVQVPRQPVIRVQPKLAPQPPQDIWERMRLGFQLQGEIGTNPRIERQRLWFVGNPSFIENASSRGSLYIHYVVERLEERDMPLELALLPVIESAYNPFAYSRSDAVGLWQFIPSTGRYYNLRQTNWYDGRRDITASTNAALSYLSRLHDMFNGDWLLALAAYNAGEGTVSRAIERNQKLGLPTDYWNLALPQETQDYVPKLLALSQLVLSPVAYGVNLNPIANEPYFEVVECKQRLDLSRVAALANIEEDELYQLNPAFKKRITLDGPQHLLVPTQKAGLLATSLSSMKPEDVPDWQQYRVRRGDTLDRIAGRYGVPVATLRSINDLSSNRLRVGQQLSVPMSAGAPRLSEPSVSRALASSASVSRPTARAYTVRNGDNLWQIAKVNNVDVKDIQRWNRLSGNALKTGQVLQLQAPAGKAPSVMLASADKAPAAAKPAATSTRREDVTYYKVREGDSMYLIAKRFNVEMQHLRNWNPRSGHALKPGQTLTLRLGSR